jgi:hypothetical protein
MLRCASPFVIAAYDKVRLTPQDSRALPAAFFTKPSDFQDDDSCVSINFSIGAPSSDESFPAIFKLMDLRS